MKPSSITTLAALLIIGLGGFMAGRISSSDSANHDPADPSKLPPSRPSDPSSVTEKSAELTGKSKKSTRVADPISESPAGRLSRLEGIMRGENPLDRNRALLDFIDQLGPGDFEGAVAHFRSLGITLNRLGEYGMLLSAWAKVDPLAALDYAKKNTTTPFASNTVLTTWASVDPEAAIRWAQANHTGDGANPYLAGIIRSLAASDPIRASQLLTAMPRSVERGEALDAMLPHILSQGSDATRAWISSLTDDALRDGAMSRAAESLARTDPAGTAAWLLSNPGEAARRNMDDVYSAWMKQDKQGAMTSLAALPSGENRSNALRGMVNSVATNNPQEAVSLMDRYTADVNDRVVQNFVWHSFGNDPSVAVNQIARITDEGDRNKMYGRTISSWMESDPTAAQAWLQRNPLPQPVLQRIQQEIDKPR